MCLLALFFRVVEGAPVVAGANREEWYARGGEPPRILEGSCPALAGVDPLAGGTWFGANGHGVLIAVTNRLKSQVPKQPRSRGLLARDLLACSSAAAAVDRAVRELDHGRYAGCNLLCADRDSATAIHAGDWLRVRPLSPGIHVLTARDINDGVDRRIAHALDWLSRRGYASADHCVGALKELCSQAGNGDPPMCLHGELGGTVSSSIAALCLPPEGSIYLHAQGPPDSTPYADYSPLLRQLLSTSRAQA